MAAGTFGILIVIPVTANPTSCLIAKNKLTHLQ